MPAPIATLVSLPAELRLQLEVISRSQTASVRQVRRARIALLADRGWSNQRIAQELGVSDKTVRDWRGRVAALAQMKALEDRPRSGRPTQVPLAVRLQLVSLACSRATDDKTPFREVWSQAALQEALEQATGWRLSISEVGRILRAEDIRPHRVRMWLNSQDDRFWEKAEAVCKHYVDPEVDTTVLSIDEKRLFAHERLHELRPAGPSQPVRKDFGYRRNGSSTLLAAFDVRTGQVYGECRSTRTAGDLMEFMETLAGSIKGKVLVIWDNLNIHHDGKDDRWTRFNERHGGRFTFVYTPVHASWLNQIEIWFSTLERRLLRHGSFPTVAGLNERVEDFIVHYNEHEAHPYRWTFRAEQGKKIRHAQVQRGDLPVRGARRAAA
jgi:transposase